MAELIKMPVIEERKVTKSGSSFVVTLPQAWAEENNLKGGEMILVKANGYVEIRVKNDDNIKKMNEEVRAIRSQLANHNLRSDDDQTGDKAKAQSSPKNNK